VTHFLKLLKFTANPINPADPADLGTEIKQAYPDLKIYEGLQKPGEAQGPVLGAKQLDRVRHNWWHEKPEKL